MTVAGLTLVTGATGFIGRPLTERLAREGPVRALVRRGEAPAGAQVVEIADLSRVDQLAPALQGVDRVVHLAARAHVMHASGVEEELAEYRRVNVDGTRVLLEAAIRAGARRFILISSVKAVGERNDEPWTELSEPRPADPYGVSKLEAERLVEELGSRGNMETVILRLPLVYGPGVRANALRLVHMVDRGWPLPLGLVRNRRSMASVGNVIAAIRSTLEVPAAAGHTFFMSDEHDLSTPDLLRVIAHALGKTARLVPVPVSMLRVVGYTGDLLSRLVPSPLTSATLGRLVDSLMVDSFKFRRITGFTPPETPAQGWQAVADWYRSSHSALAPGS